MLRNIISKLIHGGQRGSFNVIVGVAIISIALVFIGGIGEMANMSEDDASTLGVLIQEPTYETSGNAIQYMWDVVVYRASSFWALVKMATFGNPMFDGAWKIVWFLVFLPIGIGIVWLIAMAVRGNPT